MFEVKGTTITLTRGDTGAVMFEILAADGGAYTPREGDRVRFAAKKSVTDEAPCILKGIPTDTMTLTLEPEDTKALEPDAYVYDVQITFAGGEVATFVPKSRLNIAEEVD